MASHSSVASRHFNDERQTEIQSWSVFKRTLGKAPNLFPMEETAGPATPAETATPAYTRDYVLKKSGRRYTTVRHIFTQLPSDSEHRPSVLGPMVTERKRRSLQLYLLLLTVWPWLEAKDPPLLPAETWARALRTDGGRHWTPTNVSAAWSDLEQRGLVERHRHARGVEVLPRREDGKDEYTKPGLVEGDRRETYFVLPGEFWTEEWFERLTMPGLAMLLIIAAETSSKTEVWLTNEHAAQWYGLSPRSVEAGIEDLREQKLLVDREEWVKAPLSAIGTTKRHWYGLTGPFSTEARAKLQKTAQAEFKARPGAKARKGSSMPAGESKKRAEDAP